MSWSGYTVIDMDAHIRERADRFYKDYVDPEYRGAYQQLCEAIAKQEAKGESYSLFGSRNSVIEQIETGSLRSFALRSCSSVISALSLSLSSSGIR